MAVPARLETVLDKLGVMASEHFVDPGPEQAQGRCALLPCWQVWPPDGPLAPGLGRLRLGQLRYQRGEVIEPGSEFSNCLPLSLDVVAEGGQAPVQPLILLELLGRGVIEVVFQFSESLPLCLNVLAEGVQAPVKPLVLVELALLVRAEVSQELGQLGSCPSSRLKPPAQRLRVSSTPASRPPILAISWARATASPLPGGRSASLMGCSSPAGVILWLRHGADPHHLLLPLRSRWRHAGPARR